MNQTKGELNTLQISYKNLNKKFTQSISEKDTQIFQYQQSLVCKQIKKNYMLFCLFIFIFGSV